jgi:molybdopterin/thiamine biosynthesis adenylyltransferase
MQRDFSRQSFLGSDSEETIAQFIVGVVGLSGGGSHIVQQLAHIGFQNYIVIDPKRVTPSNLNRHVLASNSDVKDGALKTVTASRKITGLNPSAKIFDFAGSWQSYQYALKGCDVIFGCVDSFAERDQLDRFCRRFLIPFIDIGMDVIPYQHGFKLVGQVAVSHPDGPCLRCMNIVTDDRLSREAEEYGAAGDKPQVVWPNGVLASTAIGLLISLITPWTSEVPHRYFEYNGNVGSIIPSNRWQFIRNQKCKHYSTADVGDPFFRLDRATQPSS